MKPKVLVVSQNAREAIIADELSKSCQVYAVIKHKNPSILRAVAKSGGRFLIGDVNNREIVSEFAVANKIDLAIVTADDPLSNGVVDSLKSKGVSSFGATKSGSEIEWNKIFSRELMSKVAPEANPFFRVAKTKEEVDKLFSELGEVQEVAVKPVGLTGGKGVKVMGPHLDSLDSAKGYCYEVLDSSIGGSDGVIVEEKLVGKEFALQCFTDGISVSFSPVTYDYPYRFDGDTGPGTGGMGSFTLEDGRVPFVSQATYEKACNITKLAIDEVKAQGRDYSGVVYPAFFLTDSGQLKLIEFNARFGDPECMNIVSLIDYSAGYGSLLEVCQSIATKELEPKRLNYKSEASLVVYLVAPKYGMPDAKSAPTEEFEINEELAGQNGVKVFFGSSVCSKDYNQDICDYGGSLKSELLDVSGWQKYKTFGTSRTVCYVATGKDISDCYERISKSIKESFRGNLDWRLEIGLPEYIKNLK